MNRYPAIICEYLPKTRMCRIDILGLTDNSATKPLAEIEYPIGDKSAQAKQATEILLQKGDAVWVAFIGGDFRYPIITGFRNAQSNNCTNWRRFHQQNIELLSEQIMRLLSSQIMELIAPKISLNADNSLTIKTPKATINADNLEINSQNLTANAQNAQIIAQNIMLNAPSTTISGILNLGGALLAPSAGIIAAAGNLTHNGKDIGATHKHQTNKEFTPTTPPI